LCDEKKVPKLIPSDIKSFNHLILSRKKFALNSVNLILLMSCFLAPNAQEWHSKGYFYSKGSSYLVSISQWFKEAVSKQVSINLAV
jgi:hypothetical protein